MKLLIAAIFLVAQAAVACPTGVNANRATVSAVDKTPIGSAADKDTTTIIESSESAD